MPGTENQLFQLQLTPCKLCVYIADVMMHLTADDIGSGATPTLRAGARATDEIEIESTSTSDFLSISLTIGVAVLVFVIATTLAVLLLWVIRRRGRRSADTRSNKDSVESSNTQLQHTTTQDIKEEEKLK